MARRNPRTGINEKVYSRFCFLEGLTQKCTFEKFLLFSFRTLQSCLPSLVYFSYKAEMRHCVHRPVTFIFEYASKDIAQIPGKREIKDPVK